MYILILVLAPCICGINGLHGGIRYPDHYGGGGHYGYHPCNPPCDYNSECQYGRCQCREPYVRSNKDFEKCVHPCDNKGCGHQCDRYSIKCSCPHNQILNNDEKTCSSYEVDNTKSLKHGVYLVKEKLTFNDAFRKCLYGGAVLVDIHGKESLNDALFKYIENIEEPIWVRNSVIQNCILVKDKKITFTDCDSKHYFACYGVAGYPTQYNYKFTNEQTSYTDAGARCDLATIKNVEMLAHIYKSIPESMKKKAFYISSSTRNFPGRWGTNQSPTASRQCVILEDGEYYNVDCYKNYGRVCQNPIKSFEDRCAKVNCPNNNCIHTGREMKCDCGKDKKFDESKYECVSDHCKTAKCTQFCSEGKCSCDEDYALYGKQCIHKICLSRQCTVRCAGNKCGCNPGYELNKDERTCTKYLETDMITIANGMYIVNIQKDFHDAQRYCSQLNSDLIDVTDSRNLESELYRYIANKKLEYWVIDKNAQNNANNEHYHSTICSFVKDDQVLRSDDCRSRRNIICKIKGQMPPGLTAPINIVNIKKTYQEAHKYCLHRGAVLFDIGENLERKDELFKQNLDPSNTYLIRKLKTCQSALNKEISATGCSGSHFFICQLVDDSLSPYRYKVTLEQTNYAEANEKCDLALVDNLETEALIYRDIPRINEYLRKSYFARTTQKSGNPEGCTTLYDGSVHHYSHYGCIGEGRVCQFLNRKHQEECAKKNCPNKKCIYQRNVLECACPEKFEYHKDNNICLPKNDCSKDNNNPCSHYCTLEDQKFVCLCPDGMFLDKNDKKTCHDLNKICDYVEHGCSQICKPNLNSYKCECRLGYLMQDDRKSCKAGYDSRMYRYQAIGFHSYNFDGARLRCEQSNMKLLSIHSQEEANYIKNKVVNDLFFKSSSGEYWIGLSDRKRNVNDFAWIDGTSLDFKNWRQNEPNGGDNENCVALDINTNQWNDIDCGREIAGIICKRQVIEECSECSQLCYQDGDFYGCSCKKGYLLQSDGRTCKEVFDVERYVYSVHYEFIGSRHTYESARKGCESVGADLAKITHQIEQDHILALVKAKSFFLKVDNKNLYIGLTDKKVEKDFRWEDGSPLKFTNWEKNEPNNAFGDEHCVAMVSNTGKWNDIQCSTKADGYICKRKNHCFNNFCKNGGICRQNNFQGFCSCKSGLIGPQCERDINECEIFPFFCQDDCTNTVGSFKCSCPNNYDLGLFQKSCHVKGSACVFSHHGCEVCIDKGDKQYECGCNPGFQLDDDKKTCKDIDECQSNVCGNAACRNIPGSYYCECDHDMDLKEDGPKCEEYSLDDTIHYISVEQLSYWGAVKYCESRNGYLTGISGPLETKAVSRRLEKNKIYWIGYHKSINVWKWVKGAFKYKNWMQDRPEQNSRNKFAAIKYDELTGFKWFDFDDSNVKNYFICKMPKRFPWVPQHFRYIVSTEKATWDDAAASCEKQDGRLVNIQNKQEQEFIENGSKFRDTQYWIGLQQGKNTSIQKWSTQARLVGYSNLMDNNVTMKDMDQCAVIGKEFNFKWKMIPCIEQHHYICKKSFFNHGPYKFYISHVRLNFEMAKQFCYSYNGQLVSYSDQSEESFLDWTLIKSEKYWIGAVKSTGDKWKWLDGSKFEYANWKYEKSDKSCATKVYSDDLFAWRKTDCNDYAYAICKVDFIQIMQYKYIYEDTPHSWKEADSYCKRHNGELTNIVDEKIYGQLVPKGIPSVKYWVGYNKKYSLDRWSDTSLVGYKNFAQVQNGDCAWFERSSQSLQFDDCTLRRGLLCKVREFPLDNYDYHFVRTKETWEHARMNCWKMGGELTSITKNEEILFGEHSSINEELWHGLYNFDDELVWVDGSKSSYRNLHEFDRVYDNQCVYMKKTHDKKFTWKIGDCSYKRSFVCKVPRYQTRRYKYYLSLLKVDQTQAERICSSYNGELLGMRTEKPKCLDLKDEKDSGEWLSDACATDMVFACKIDKFSPFNDTYINREDVTLQWKDAVSYCTKDVGNLVSIITKGEETHIATLMKPNIDYWTGLQRLSSGLKWSDDEPVGYIPNINGVTNNYCIMIRKVDSGNIEYTSRPCTTSARVICKVPPYFNRGMFEYYTTSERKSLDNARQDCLKNGYELISVISKDEEESLKSSIKSSYYTWIGATNFALKDKYQWYDGQRTTYQNWYSGNPTYSSISCAAMGTDLQWRSVDCDTSSNYYMCRRRVKGVWALYGINNKSPTPCQRKPCRNLGSCSMSGSDFKCSCKEGFSGMFCGNGDAAFNNLKSTMKKVFDGYYGEKQSTIKSIADGLKLYTNDCRGIYDQICHYNKVYVILHKKLMQYYELCKSNDCSNGKQLRLAFSAWLLSHAVEAEESKTIPIAREVLENLYAWVSRYDRKSVKTFADYVPTETFYNLLYLKFDPLNIDPFKRDMKDTMSDSLQSITDFLVSLSRTENAKSKIVVSRYDLREKLRLSKLDSIFTNIKANSYEVMSELQEISYQIKKFIYEDTESHFKNLQSYFASLAKFDRDKNKADVEFIDGQLTSFKTRADALARELGDKMVPILAGVSSALVAELIQAKLQMSSLFTNFFAALFGQTSASDYHEAAALIAQTLAKMARLARLGYYFDKTKTESDQISSKFNENSKFLQNVYTLVKSFTKYYGKEDKAFDSNARLHDEKSKFDEKAFNEDIKKFLKLYSAYNPQVQQQELDALEDSWESVLDEACDLLFDGQTSAAAVVEIVFAGRGDCIKTKSTIAQFVAVLGEIYEYQFEMMESLAKVCRAELASQRAKGLQSRFNEAQKIEPKKNTTQIAAFEQMILGLQITSVLYKLGIIIQYCDYREFLNAGIMPKDCKEAITDLSPDAINSLISLREATCPNRRTMFVDIPVENPFEDTNFAYIPLDKLFKGESIKFQIPSYDWLIRNGWISKHDYENTAFYLEDMKVFLPHASSDVLDVQVSISWTEKTHLYNGFSGLGNTYVIEPNQMTFEYQEELNCRPTKQMINPYDRCFNRNNKICISLERKSNIVSPSIFSLFTIQAKTSPLVTAPPKFTTKLYLKAEVTICQVRRDGKVFKRRRKRDTSNRCCVDINSCSKNQSEKYWNAFLQEPACVKCPEESVADITGHYCFMKAKETEEL